MTAPAPRDQLRDGCPHCGDHGAVTDAHRRECADFHANRRAAREAVPDVPPVCVDDLFAHITTPRCGGPWATPGDGVEIIRCLVDLGWRPVVGSSHE